MPKFQVTICSGIFEIDAADEDEAIDSAREQADYEVEEIDDDDEDDEDDEDESDSGT